MSLSKLESLPNEILTEIIEKYINGVDLLVAFNYQLNRRFNALIYHCRRLHFDFIQCRKDDFCFCMGLLPAYIDKVEELAISEKDTPGQVHAFLSFFPSFVPFKRLRRLYFHFDVEVVDGRMVETALRSLLDTSIQTLSIKKIGTTKTRGMSAITADLFQLQSLKRFSIMIPMNYYEFYLMTVRPPNIEHLTISGIHWWDFQDLQQICRIAPRLKYLNLRIVNDSTFYSPETPQYPANNVTPLKSVLRTLILCFQRDDSTTLDMLAELLKSTSVLTRLEIKANSKLLDADRWERIIETSLPLLIHFTLRTTVLHFRNLDRNKILASFQTSFWIAKKSFNIIITEHIDDGDVNTFDRDHSMQDHSKLGLPVIRYWTAPDRTADGNLIMLNEITSFRPPDINSNMSSHHYFNNVKYFEVDVTDKCLIKWMITYVNCSQIKKLTITPSKKKIDELTALLAVVTSISSLRVELDLLIANKDAFVGTVHCLRCLDISVALHKFNEEDISIIAELFPCLEHLKINASNLYNVSKLKRYLPQLRSLTYEIPNMSRTSLSEYSSAMWDSKLREKTHFLFQHKQSSVIVWINQAALEEEYWRTSVEDTPDTTARVPNTRKNKIKKFFKNLFK